MATFNTYVKLGTRGNSLLSFNLSGCTNSNTNSCTALPDYQDVLHTRFDGSGLYVTGLTLHSTYFIYIEANRRVSGSTCNLSLTNQMIQITGIPTPTPTPTPTAVPTTTPTNTPTPSPTPIVCSFDGTVVYGLSGTAIPTATPTSSPSPATYTPTPTNTTAPSPATYTPTPTATPIPYQLTVFTGNSLSTACSNLVNPSLEPTILFYQGSLGIGTILYRNNNYTNAVTPTVYCAVDSETVYVVGTPSNTDGEITSITSCPAATLEPTPIPEPTTFDVYTVCSDLVTRYYVDHYTSNFNFSIVNGVCCSKDATNVSMDYINTNYPSATYQTIINTQCICN